MNKYFKQKDKALLITYFVVLIVMLLIPCFEITREIFLHWIFVKVPYPYAAFLLGIILKKAEHWDGFISLYNPLTCAFGIILLSFMYRKGIRIDISAGEVNNPVIFITASTIGWFMLLSISKKIVSNIEIGNALSYIGKHTIPILYLHFLAFKVVSILYVIINKEPWYLVASFPIIFNSGFEYRLLYIIAGVFIPLGIQKLANKDIYLGINK